jgi:hypothetical protein
MRLGGLGTSTANHHYEGGNAGSVWGRPVHIQRTRTNRYDNDVAVRDTIRILSEQARNHANDPSVHWAVAQACARLPLDASERDIAGAMHHWVRAHIRFVEDETLLYSQLGIRPEELDKELLITPPVLLGMPQPMGDCDDYSLLLASMALAAGIQPYYVTVAADPYESPQKFSHIYVCVRLEDEDGYLCLDAGNRYQAVPPGWETGKCTRKAVWRI